MQMSEESRNKFSAETALKKGVDEGKLHDLPAESYKDILRELLESADGHERRTARKEIPRII